MKQAEVESDSDDDDLVKPLGVDSTIMDKILGNKKKAGSLA